MQVSNTPDFQLTLPREELERTARQMNLPGFGPEQQQRLHNAHVLVIGVGGLGCPIMQTLAATGVGNITVYDDDTVALSNIHRQILFNADDVGKAKVEVAAKRIQAIQPHITVHARKERLTEGNFIQALEGIDLLIDGSDTFQTKFLAADAAEITGTPLMWGSVLRYRGDVALWWSGPGAPDDGVGMRDLYPAQPDADSVPDCATAGVLGVTTSVVGGLMATEAVKFLTGLAPVPPGRLHMYDALSATIRQFNVSRDPARALVEGFGVYDASCALPSNDGQELLDLLDRGEAVALDVREPHEKVLSDIAHPGQNLPMSQVAQDSNAAEQVFAALPAGDVIVYCASGKRSTNFVEEYAGNAAKFGLRLHSLPGGANRWALP